MTHFPQPNPAQRARRVRVPGSIVVVIHSKGSQPVRAKLYELSATGGLLVLSKAFEEGDFVEVAFQTSHGAVRGMAELLSEGKSNPAACNPFRSSPWGTKPTPDCMTLESLRNQILIGSSQPVNCLP
jgi:hypothetical protein